jgi:hypothetical protein
LQGTQNAATAMHRRDWLSPFGDCKQMLALPSVLSFLLAPLCLAQFERSKYDAQLVRDIHSDVAQ